MAIKKVGMTIKKVAMTGLLLLMGFEAKAQCVMNQDCAALGYTKTASECSGKNGLKCPFGDKWSCGAESQRLRCNIGWIYYADGTCSFDKISGKVALGVVVYVNPCVGGGQVMAARDVGSMYWSTELVDNQWLPNVTSDELAMYHYGSCGSTSAIIMQGNSSKYPAAWAARKYAPTPETKGKWCLPAAGILSSAHDNRSAVNVGIAKLGGTKFTGDTGSWSSTEYNIGSAWLYWPGSGMSLTSSYGKNFSSFSVRPVMEF